MPSITKDGKQIEDELTWKKVALALSRCYPGGTEENHIRLQ
jgi:hypothetical protein